LLVAGTRSTTSTSTSAGTSVAKIDELIKAMEQMSIQAIELKKLREQMTSLETNYELAQIQNKEEEIKNRGMEERIKVLEKDLTLEKPLGDMKIILWANIIDSINDIWPSIQVIFEQTELIKVAMEDIQKTKEELGDKPKEENQLIDFLNSRNRYHLDELQIEDRTSTNIEIKKVLTKRNLMLNLEKRCHSIQVDIDSFMLKYGILREKGLPSPLVIHDKLMT